MTPRALSRLVANAGGGSGDSRLRAQEILYYFCEGVEDRYLKHFANVFLDSPMAISATEIFARHQSHTL